MKRMLGMSTGVLYKRMASTSQRIIDIQKSLGNTIIEISCVRKEELFRINALNGKDTRAYFEYLSLHAPNDLEYGVNEETKKVLNAIADAHKLFQFNLVVFHPEKVVDWSVFDKLSFPVGMENADWRKDFGRTIEDMIKVFERVDAGFVLDVNHCFTNDKSMKLANEFINRFSNRL